MRSAQQVIEAIHAARFTGRKVGLENTRALMDRLHIATTVPAIHVAGTNGKGSVCAMVERVLRQAGYATGLYTSPYLQVYNERIRLNGEPVSDELLARYGNQVLDAAAELEKEGVQPTAFELGTALALLIFQQQKADVMVIEVGIGGRLDPTNVITPLVSVITAIGLDHMQILGDTLAKIAGEKAGIIKPETPVVCHPAETEVAQVFAQRAEALHAPLIQLATTQIRNVQSGRYGSEADYDVQGVRLHVATPLPGAHQLTNTLTALNALTALSTRGFPISQEAMRQGMALVRWPARLEWAGNVLLDGGHNPQGIAALMAYVQTWLRDTHRVLVTGVLEDHLQPDMLQSLSELGQEIITITPDSPRAMQGERLAEQLRRLGRPAQYAPGIHEAMQLAQQKAGSEGVVLVAGSLYLAGAVRTELGLPWK